MATIIEIERVLRCPMDGNTLIDEGDWASCEFRDSDYGAPDEIRCLWDGEE